MSTNGSKKWWDHIYIYIFLEIDSYDNIVNHIKIYSTEKNIESRYAKLSSAVTTAAS